MCYTGKCSYEDYMGDCKAPYGLKNACKKGHRLSLLDSIKLYLKWTCQTAIHSIKYKFNTEYKEKWDNIDFPF